jgi:hypothetical protein
MHMWRVLETIPASELGFKTRAGEAEWTVLRLRLGVHVLALPDLARLLSILYKCSSRRVPFQRRPAHQLPHMPLRRADSRRLWY